MNVCGLVVIVEFLKTQSPIVPSPLDSVQQKYFLARVGLLEIILEFLEMPILLYTFFNLICSDIFQTTDQGLYLRHAIQSQKLYQRSFT